MKSAKQSSSEKKKKKGSYSSSSLYSDSSSSSTDSSSDDKKKKSKKKRSRKDDNNDKTLAKANSKVRKVNKVQKLTQSMEEAPTGMLNMATKLHELRGLPEAIQKQFKEQQAKSEG